MKGLANAGITLLEILVALGILAFGMVPIFMTFSETRRVTTGSINEMKATSMASSMIDGMMRVPAHLIDPQEQTRLTGGCSDDSLPPDIGLASIGVSPAYPGLDRQVNVNLVNAPLLPGERFSNPWGRVAEIAVTIRHKGSSASTTNPSRWTHVLTMKGYRQLAVRP